ncbi:MAG TPA: hypothetical protein VEA78_11550 [Acidimicrobiales bacterium]|nr:hypothetical protein [Acidimicrobiales bacterium]
MRRVAVIATLLVLPLAACGDDGGGTDPEAQPSPEVTTFGEGDFDDIPIPSLAEEAGPRSDEDGVTTQSYFVRNRTPAEVMAFYEAYFADEDVPVVVAPEATGTDAWRGWWLLDDRELLVSAIPAPSVEGAEVEHSDVVTQMSLELWPSGSAEEHAPPVTVAAEG